MDVTLAIGEYSGCSCRLGNCIVYAVYLRVELEVVNDAASYMHIPGMFCYIVHH